MSAWTWVARIAVDVYLVLIALRVANAFAPVREVEA